jgi:flavin reductase (DIM6/NTAB) family NADH-FMN oxidoreductase RutF
MDPNAKKTALRMIPYGLYVLTAEAPDGRVAAATVNFVTQTSFAPPMVAVGIKADSASYALVKDVKAFALNMLGKDQKGAAFAFFKPADKVGDKIGGEPYRKGSSGAPILLSAAASVECKVVDIVEKGDHHIVVAEVVDAEVAKAPEGRPDQAILTMADLGPNVFYGG